MKYRRKERGHYRGEKSKQGLISAKDLTIELPEGQTIHEINQRFHETINTLYISRNEKKVFGSLKMSFGSSQNGVQRRVAHVLPTTGVPEACCPCTAHHRSARGVLPMYCPQKEGQLPFEDAPEISQHTLNLT